MENFDPRPFVGKASVIIIHEMPDGQLAWNQGDFARGEMVNVKSAYAFCNMVANNVALWQAIPDEATVVNILPFPLQGYGVRVVSGDHAGLVGWVTATRPADCSVVIEPSEGGANGAIEASAACVELHGRRRKGAN